MKMLQSRRRLFLLSLAGVLALAIATLALITAPRHRDTGLAVSAAWVRPTPPGAAVAAAYAVLENPGRQPLRIVGVHSPAARLAQIHEMSMDGGLMRMRELSEGLVVPAGGRVALAPGGLHLMLVDPVRPLAAGDLVSLVFQVEGGPELTVLAPVREAAP